MENIDITVQYCAWTTAIFFGDLVSHNNIYLDSELKQ